MLDQTTALAPAIFRSAALQANDEWLKPTINAVLNLVTGILPKWVITIAKFGGLASLIHNFLFKAFTFGATFSMD